MHLRHSFCKSQNSVFKYKYFSVADLDRQLILTKDNITVNIDTCVYYRVIDAKVAYYTITNMLQSVA